MVLRLKTRESRSLPGLPSARSSHIRIKRSGWRLIFSLRLYDACRCPKTARHFWATCIRPAKRDPGPRERPFRLVALESGKRKLTSMVDAGWSSPVARQAHNLKVTGSNPVPATKYKNGPPRAGRFGIRGAYSNPLRSDSPPLSTLPAQQYSPHAPQSPGWTALPPLPDRRTS